MSPLTRISIFSGLGAGVLHILFFFVLLVLSIPLFDNFVRIEFIVPMMFCVTSLWFYRFIVRDNEMRFWEGLIICFFTALIGSIIYGVFVYSYLEFVDISLLQSSIDLKLAEIDLQKDFFISSGNEAHFISSRNVYVNTTELDLLADKILVNSIAGIFYAFLLSVIFRK